MFSLMNCGVWCRCVRTWHDQDHVARKITGTTTLLAQGEPGSQLEAGIADEEGEHSHSPTLVPHQATSTMRALRPVICKLSFPDFGRRYLLTVPDTDPAECTGRQSSNRCDPVPSRWRMFWISSARLRLTPFRRPTCLPVALTRFSSANVRSRARSLSMSF